MLAPYAAWERPWRFPAAMEYEYWEAASDGLDRYLAEQHIYGNGAQGRIGMYIPYAIRNTSEQVPDPVDGDVYSRELLKKIYELKDHLGNVRVVLTDLKADNAAAMAAVPGPWGADVRSWQNYYPFGMLQPGRYGDNSINPNRLNYRYGFNGKEMDNEVRENPTTGTVGTGNHYDYGFRVYDPRIAKFLSVDPLTKDYPWYTPYQFAGNKPIRFIDLDGLEEAEPSSLTVNIDGLNTQITLTVENEVEKERLSNGMELLTGTDIWANELLPRLQDINAPVTVDFRYVEAWILNDVSGKTFFRVSYERPNNVPETGVPWDPRVQEAEGLDRIYFWTISATEQDLEHLSEWRIEKIYIGINSVWANENVPKDVAEKKIAAVVGHEFVHGADGNDDMVGLVTSLLGEKGMKHADKPSEQKAIKVEEAITSELNK